MQELQSITSSITFPYKEIDRNKFMSIKVHALHLEDWPELCVIDCIIIQIWSAGQWLYRSIRRELFSL